MPRWKSIEARFWDRVNKTSDCWLWTGSHNGVGYGVFSAKAIQKNMVYAHRYSWTLHNGPIPEGMFILHRCDTPQCCNPAHLSIGTQKDNMQDASRKGRMHKPRVRKENFHKGTRHWQSKLSDAIVLEMLSLHKQGWKGSQIADKFQITRSVVCEVLNNKAWCHVPRG